MFDSCRPCASVSLFLLLVVSPTLADHAFVVTTDFATGGVAHMDPEAPWTVFDDDVVPACSDAVVRTFGDHHYLINRFGCDNIQVVDVPAFDTVAEYSVGAVSNPQDIAVVSSSKAYVSRYESRWLYVLHPLTGAVSDSIDFGAYADGDGLPEMSMMAVDGDRVYVQVQRLDRDNFYTPVAPSYLVMINTTTDTIAGAVALTGTNPSGKMQVLSRRLYVTTGGAFGVNDGGIEAVDLDANTSLGFATTEAQLGGDVSCGRLAEDVGHILVSSDFFFTTSLVRFDAVTGAPLSTSYTTDAFVPCLVYDAPTNQLFFPDRDATNPGLRVFDGASGAQLTSAPIDVGLPPFDMTVHRTVVAAPEASLADLVTISAHPNPSPGRTALSVQGEFGEITRAEVFDATGRFVAALDPARLAWDGRDRSGRAVGSGLYFIRVTDGVRVVSSRLVVRR